MSRLFDLEAESEIPWSTSDLAHLWRHQLATRLSADLSLPDSSTGSRTFADLLQSTAPPLELLELVKQFARRAAAESPPALPREVAAMLYLAANCAALVQLGRKISSATPSALAAQLQQALTQPWLDEATRRLLQAASRVAQ